MESYDKVKCSEKYIFNGLEYYRISLSRSGKTWRIEFTSIGPEIDRPVHICKFCSYNRVCRYLPHPQHLTQKGYEHFRFGDFCSDLSILGTIDDEARKEIWRFYPDYYSLEKHDGLYEIICKYLLHPRNQEALGEVEKGKPAKIGINHEIEKGVLTIIDKFENGKLVNLHDLIKIPQPSHNQEGEEKEYITSILSIHHPFTPISPYFVKINPLKY